MTNREARNRIRKALLAESIDNDEALRTLKVQTDTRSFPNQFVLLDVEENEQFVVTVTKARRRRDV